MDYYKSVKCYEYQAQEGWIELWKITASIEPFVPHANSCVMQLT